MANTRIKSDATSGRTTTTGFSFTCPCGTVNNTTGASGTRATPPAPDGVAGDPSHCHCGFRIQRDV